MVTIQSYARLNMGLIDLSDEPHRIDGSHGLYTNLPIGHVVLRVAEHDKVVLHTEYTQRIHTVIKQCKNLFANPIPPVSLSVEQFLPGHIGLGGGTQLAMSVVEAYNSEFHLHLSLNQKAFLAQSGGTSGVGAYCFDHGGYNLEAGRLYPSEKASVGPGENYSYRELAPLLAHIPIPEWFICIAIPKHSFVVCGNKETALFQKYTPIPVHEVDEQCKWILKGILPALITKDFPSFCLAVERGMKLGFRAREIQTYGNFQTNAMEIMYNAGLRGVGMTSFGPTLFGFSNEADAAQRASQQLIANGSFEKIFLSTARNSGADIAEG